METLIRLLDLKFIGKLIEVGVIKREEARFLETTIYGAILTLLGWISISLGTGDWSQGGMALYAFLTAIGTGLLGAIAMVIRRKQKEKEAILETIEADGTGV